jgi:hypothetical protein
VGWIVLAVVLALAVVLLFVLLMRRRSRTRAESRWRPSARAALGTARLTQQLLAGTTPAEESAGHRAELGQRVQEAASDLDRAAATAPDDEGRNAASSSADALRAVNFALEAQSLLRDGARAPTGDELARADQARRARQAELDTALNRLATRVGISDGGQPPT